MPLPQGYRGEEPETVARQMFYEDPSLSIDEVARMLDKQHKGLPRQTLSRLRQEVRQKVQSAGERRPMPSMPPQNSTSWAGRNSTFKAVEPYIRKPGDTAVKAPPPEPFNPPRMVPSSPAAADHLDARQLASPPLSAKTDTNPQGGTVVAKDAESSSEERFKWLQDAALEHPDWSVARMRQAMLDKFKKAMGSQIINDTLRAAREAAGVQPKPSISSQARALSPAPKTSPEPLKIKISEADEHAKIRMVVDLLRELHVSRIELDSTGVKIVRAQELSLKL